MRHLIVAVDKRSKLSPTPILDMFRQELGMNIVEWGDHDFMNMTDLPSNATAHATRERHLVRQRRFLEKCVEHYVLRYGISGDDQPSTSRYAI
jgi:hypothetical protein